MTDKPVPPRTTPDEPVHGEASNPHQGLRRPADDERVEDRLANIGLESPAADLEDFLGDKRGKGVPGGYDDAIAHRGDKH